MRSDRETALKLILAHEGGKVDHPRDPGGRTNRGITQKVYDGWRRAGGAPTRDVFLSTLDEAIAIYGKQYLDPIRYDDLPAGLNYAVADAAVNSGVSRAVKMLQRAVGTKEDGALGEVTLGRVTALCKDRVATKRLIEKYIAIRFAFLKSLRTWATFGKGWTRRVHGDRIGAQNGDYGVIDYAFAMVDGGEQNLRAARAIGALDGELPGKASAKDIAVTSTNKGMALISAGAVAGISGIAAMLQQLSDQLGPLADLPGVGNYIGIAAGLLSVGATGILLYTAIQNLREQWANG